MAVRTSPKSAVPPDERELRLLLDRKQIRVTPQRMVILRELARLKLPASHPELTGRLAGELLDRATIYRNLLSLTEAGILVRAQLGDGVWRFGLPPATPSEHHHCHPHFLCTSCGDVACLPRDSVTLHGTVARNEIAAVQLHGQCATCVETRSKRAREAAATR